MTAGCPTGPSDIVKNPKSIALYDTITLKLHALPTGSDCSPSDIVAYEVLVDAPGFTVDKIGDALRSRKTLLASACSLSPKAPPSAEPWRWNLMATTPGNHVVTLLMQALDKNNNVVDSREVDIPVFVPTPPQTLAANIGLISVLVTIVSGMIGLWQRYKGKSIEFRRRLGRPQSRRCAVGLVRRGLMPSRDKARSASTLPPV